MNNNLNRNQNCWKHSTDQALPGDCESELLTVSGGRPFVKVEKREHLFCLRESWDGMFKTKEVSVRVRSWCGWGGQKREEKIEQNL